MEYSRFLSAYRLSKPFAGDPPALNDPPGVGGVLGLRRGVYNDGTYTLLAQSEAADMTGLVAAVFPVAAGRCAVFAADWMGRLFATDTSELDGGGSATVTCFDLAEPSSFTTGSNFHDFHNVVAVEQMDDLLNMNQYREWVESGPSPGDGERCVGYKVPLFLGGKDLVGNMELTDRSVYLHLLAEMFPAIGASGSA